ncbi:hypothetical protein AcV7_010177 [Taiwanofungus camphoratus]|nr:hypothetical protein AcV7_010177 [Antrodia cinnamomea]
MDIRLAVKEYIQNQIDQVLRETHVQYWSDWEREDLRDSTEEQCLARKRDLMKMYPGLLSGAQGTKLRHGAWLPMYILRGNTSLDICVIMWKHKLNVSGLSFYNNHLDSSARFIHFVVDGATTDNTGRPDIAGRGTGFIRASQFLLEEIDRNVMQLKTRSIDSQKGLSFRIGHLVGELQWFKHPDLAKDQARVKWEDLTPPSLHGILASQVADQKDKSQQLKDQLHESRAANIYYRRFEQNLAVKTASTKPTEPYHETSLVTPDEVLITVIGLSGALTPGYVFSGIFGLVPPRQIWRISGRTPQSPQIHFYKPEKSSHAIERMLKHGRVEFYHRGQLILSGPPLNKLGINYVGNLSVTPDRMTVIMSGPLFNEYKAHLSAAVDLAFRTMPDLAVELAIDILADHGKNSGTIGRVLRPVDTEGRDAYRAAFNEAFKTLNPDLGQSNVPYPFCEEGQDLIREFGMVGYPVLGHVQMILQSSGAFPDIKVHAESLLLEAALYTHEVPGSGRLRRALAGLLPGVTEDQLSIRNFKYSFPTIIWDEDRKIFAMGVPAVCEDHANDSCVCWLGPYLADAVASWEKGHLFNVKEKPSKAAMYRAYIRSMQGVVDMREPPKIENTVVTDGHKMPPYIVGEGGENVLGYSTLTPGGFELDQTTFRVPEASVSTSLHPKSYSSTPTSRPSGSLAPEAGSVLPSKDTANEALQLDRHKIASGGKQ